MAHRNSTGIPSFRRGLHTTGALPGDNRILPDHVCDIATVILRFVIQLTIYTRIPQAEQEFLLNPAQELNIA